MMVGTFMKNEDDYDKVDYFGGTLERLGLVNELSTEWINVDDYHDYRDYDPFIHISIYVVDIHDEIVIDEYDEI